MIETEHQGVSSQVGNVERMLPGQIMQIQDMLRTETKLVARGGSEVILYLDCTHKHRKLGGGTLL